MSKPTSAAMAAAVAVVFAVGCEQATPTQPKEDAAPLFFTEQATEASSAEIPTRELAPPTYATAKLIAADVAIAAAGPVIRVYQDEQPWFGLNRANATLVAAPPAGLGKILGVDYFIHPLADLALGIPPGTAVVLITSNSFGVPTQAATQNSVAAQAALTAFLAGGGKLIVDMGDNLFSGGFIAPGSVGTPTLIFPNPRDDATLTPAAAGHPLVLGPDGAPGGGDDLDNGNIDACCFVAHGNLEQGITLPGDATPLMTAGFNGLQRTVMAEYCLGAGLVILDTNTKEFFGQQAVGSGPGFVMRNLFSYALAPETPCLILVDIDIKPGSDPNCFNNDGHGVIPVAILGAADFDVTQVDPSTVQLEGLSVASKGKSGKLMAHIEDVNGDGFDDLVLQIEDVAGTFTSGSGTATLTGNLFDGTPFEGSDDICVVPSAPPPPIGILFDNGSSSGPQSNIGNTAGVQELFEDFTVDQNWVITEINWEEHDHNQATYLSTEVLIFVGLPFNGPPVFSSTIVANRTPNSIGTILGNWDGFDYRITGVSISLPPGTYWIGLNQNFQGIRSGWDTTTGGPNTIPGFRIVNINFPAPGLVNGGNLAFTLLGQLP